MYEPGRIALIDVPSSAGARMAGQELGPQALRAAGLRARLTDVGFDVVDFDDSDLVAYTPDEASPKGQNLPLLLDVLRRVRRIVDRALEERAWPLVLGGDCTVTIGVLAGMSRHLQQTGLAYVDADLDLNTPETTRSGIFDGMVLAHLLGRGEDELRNLGERCPLLSEEHVALFGYGLGSGGVDAAELAILDASRMAKFPCEEVRGDAAGAAERALRALRDTGNSFFVHFDLDVVSAEDFPAVDVVHGYGLCLSEAQDALRVFVGSPGCIGMAVTEFNAAKDADGACADKLARVIAETVSTRLPKRGG